MRNKEYKVKPIRMSEDVWEELKKYRLESKLSWNLFLRLLIKLYLKHKDEEI